MSVQLRGIIPAVLTPYDASCRVDERQLRSHLDFLLDKGVHALFLLGTAGEGILMLPEERKRIAEIGVAHVSGRVPVIIHTGAASTQETIELTRHAAEIGAAAASIVTPYFYQLDQDSLFRHYKLICCSVPGFPIFLYNNASRTGNTISPQLLVSLKSECDNIVGLKDTSSDLDCLRGYIAVTGKAMTFLTGSNTLILASLLQGAAGAVSSIANCFPEIMLQMYGSFIRGDLTGAQSAQGIISRIWHAFSTGPFPGIYKVGLQLRGRDFARYVKPPLREATQEEEQTLRTLLNEISVL